ncbi:MAG: glucose-1-phosphate adenylyltransferase subunit GlgD, partial [Clostridiales bacterium]|nr:glucose-1-phosphate adenylyltransferase subunit GlgD [Clostridiales bacterium]
PSAEIYIIRKTLLLELIDWCRANGKLHFHRDALAHYLKSGGKIGLYIHKGYMAHICSVEDYFCANMDMLKYSCRKDLFPDGSPVYTRGRSSVSTYYGENASATNSLVADGCFIEGQLNNCILFRGVRVNKGAKLSNCVIMQDTVIGENVSLNYVISDKYAVFSDGLVLSGSKSLPITVPKGKTV